jgi:hypothetical protein
MKCLPFLPPRPIIPETMVLPATHSQTAPLQPSRARRLALKAVTLVSLGLILGFGYDWAAPRFYGPEPAAGFRLGLLHGALMPTALPSLLLGKDVPIYAAKNSGRTYKLGYIAGINLCGLVFFGSAFWRPPNRNQRRVDRRRGEEPGFGSEAHTTTKL